jgi:hypothetical protein
MTHYRPMQTASLPFIALSLLTALSACSSDGDSPPKTPDKVGTLEGSFLAELIPPLSGAAAFTKFLGVVFDGPSPPSMVTKLDTAMGDCELMVPVAVFCSPSCSAGVCTSENVCTPYPTPQNVGQVHVTGLGPTEVVMDPIEPRFSYQPSVTLPNPSCSEGGTVKVTTDKFTIEGKCVAPLELLTPEPIPVMSGKAVPLTWTAPGVSGISRVKIKLEVAHHGGAKGHIQCDVPDSGSFSIPEPLVTKLVSLGLAGFPTVVVTRVSTASADKESEVKLMVSSGTERAVDTGVISCSSDDTQCPTGQTCQPDLRCK